VTLLNFAAEKEPSFYGLIAERMQATTTVPEFTIETEVAMAESIALRRQLSDLGQARPVPTLNDLVVKAAALTLRSGGTAWYWKTAYNEAFARHAPGMLLTAALTEQLAADVTIARTDSCAATDNVVLNPLWRERLTLCDRLIAVRPEAPFAPACRLERLRRAAETAAKSVRARLRRQR